MRFRSRAAPTFGGVPVTTPPTPPRARGAVAVHDGEALLDLVRGVAEAAVADPTSAVVVPQRISMRVFNRAKVAFDRARGISDPATDPERTPTANAILMRFNDGAARRIGWGDIVAAAFLADRSMWLAAARRAEAADPVDDQRVGFALRLVANRLNAATLSRPRYRDTRDKLVADDEARHGEDAILARLLPTLNQIEGQTRWKHALRLAGMDAPAAAPARRSKPGSSAGATVDGLPVEQAIAHYAALNRAWPSYLTLLAWARDSRFAMQDRPRGGWKPVIAEARELLIGAGIEPPPGDGPRPLGKGKRLRYRYPVDGVPGAPPRADEVATVRTAKFEELCVLALRIWLADVGGRGGTTREDYLSWQVGTGWPAPSKFAPYGGFKALRARAREANAAERRQHGQPLTDMTRRRAETLRRHLTTATPDPVPFPDALKVVLARPHADGQPPKQR